MCQVLDQPGVVDLEDEAGVDDREVLLAHRLGDGLEVLGRSSRSRRSLPKPLGPDDGMKTSVTVCPSDSTLATAAFRLPMSVWSRSWPA